MALATYYLRWGVLGIGVALALSTLLQFSMLFTMMIVRYQAIDMAKLLNSQVKTYRGRSPDGCWPVDSDAAFGCLGV
jgi:Na+-driven multidrug efflux pump